MVRTCPVRACQEPEASGSQSDRVVLTLVCKQRLRDEASTLRGATVAEDGGGYESEGEKDSQSDDEDGEADDGEEDGSGEKDGSGEEGDGEAGDGEAGDGEEDGEEDGESGNDEDDEEAALPAAAEAAWPPAPPYEPPSDAEDENEDFFLRGVCGTCGDDAVDNDMMRCERCGAMHHPACARRTPRRAASAAWECEQCVAGGSTAVCKAVTISDFFVGTAGVIACRLSTASRYAVIDMH
jgi:hypothetical protein